MFLLPKWCADTFWIVEQATDLKDALFLFLESWPTDYRNITVGKRRLSGLHSLQTPPTVKTAFLSLTSFLAHFLMHDWVVRYVRVWAIKFIWSSFSPLAASPHRLWASVETADFLSRVEPEAHSAQQSVCFLLWTCMSVFYQSRLDDVLMCFVGDWCLSLLFIKKLIYYEWICFRKWIIATATKNLSNSSNKLLTNVTRMWWKLEPHGWKLRTLVVLEIPLLLRSVWRSL